MGHTEQVPHVLVAPTPGYSPAHAQRAGEQHLYCRFGRRPRVDQLRQRPINQGIFVFPAHAFTPYTKPM